MSRRITTGCRKVINRRSDAPSSGDPEAETSALEREKEELVYALHGLTKEEQDIVKGAAK